MKKLVSLLLSLALLLGMTGGVAMAAEEEPVTLTFFHAGATIIPTNVLDTPVSNAIAEKIGVKLDWSPYMGGGTANETASRLIAANDYPDIWLISDTAIINKMLEYGLVMPLDDLLENAPNVREIAGDAMNYARFRFGTDKTYMVPAQVGGVNWYPSGFDMMISYRYDLWVDQGCPKLDSYDAFLDYLRKCKEMEPVNKDGLTNYAAGIDLASEWYYVDYNMLNALGMTTKGTVCNYSWITDELTPRFAEDSVYFEGAKFWNRLYQEGLLDPESATMTIDQVQAKGQSMRYFFGAANWLIGWPNDAVRVLQADIAKKDASELTEWDKRIDRMGWVPLEITAGSENPDYVYARMGTKYGNGNYYLISSTCSNPEAAMRFIDYAASWEGAELFTNGPEGYNWHYVDGVPTQYTKAEREAMEAEGKEFLDNEQMGISYFAPLLMVNGNRQNPNGWPTLYGQANVENFQDAMSNGELAYAAENGYTYSMQYIDDNFSHNTFEATKLNLIPNIDSTSDLAVISSDIETIAYEYTVRLIYAADDAEFEAIKQEFLAELDNAGVDELVNYYITNYETAKKTAEEWGFD